MTARPVRAIAGRALLTGGLIMLTAAGCGSGSGSAPSWAAALGSGVTVQAPASTAPGNGSPGAAVEGLFSSITGKHYSAECTYIEPSVQADCKSGIASVTSSTSPSLQNAAIGYVVIDGDRALVGTTGKFCVPGQKPACYTNTNPAAIFSGNRKSFSALWTAENSISSDNVYSLAPCVKVNGKWYLYESPS
jgi:hypothetical protein